MGPQESLSEARRFGKFLRKVREGRKLSLDAVEEMSASFPERMTKSHLSRIENGHAEPSFRKLFALSQIYGMPLVTLAERFELDLKRELVPVDVAGKTETEIETEVTRQIESGRYTEALMMLIAAVDGLRDRLEGTDASGEETSWIRRFRQGIIDCLVHLGRYESAKLEAEELLSDEDLTAEQRLGALHDFVICCYRLSRFTVAMMALEQADKDLSLSNVPGKRQADFAVLRGNILAVTGRPSDSLSAYGRALGIYESLANPFEGCKTRINMASAMIDLGANNRAREQLEAALLVAEASSYDRLSALARSHMAVLAFKMGDFGAAESWAIRSNAIARSREFIPLVFRNCYYLWKIARESGDEAGVKANERTLRTLLSRVEGHLPEAEAFRVALAGGES